MMTKPEIQQALNKTLKSTDIGFLSNKYSGKIRDNYLTKDGHRVLITTDKLSAFDRIITTIPYKGELLNKISNYWFEKTKHIVKNHFIASPHPNVVIAEECTPFLVEIVVRGYITGSTGTSIWHAYKNGEREIYGIKFPEGLKKNDKLENPIITPTTKGKDGQHDELITKQEIINKGIVPSEEYNKLEEIAYQLFAFAEEEALKKGLILMDTKFEFGKTKSGDIMLIDELFTPDCSRFVLQESYLKNKALNKEPDNLNKEHLRLHLANLGYVGEGEMPPISDEIRIETSEKYMLCYEKLTGQNFVSENKNQPEDIKQAIMNFLNS